ncbi:MAG: hypothetical protein FWE20_00760 [Defluviitaleaceae bacterium]|nr:hypothetical protein [Defluviitaleaceae bacterium]
MKKRMAALILTAIFTVMPLTSVSAQELTRPFPNNFGSWDEWQEWRSDNDRRGGGFCWDADGNWVGGFCWDSDGNWVGGGPCWDADGNWIGVSEQRRNADGSWIGGPRRGSAENWNNGRSGRCGGRMWR